ncbi:PAS domain-containing protein [Rhodobacter sphaeroides]|nr:PAS domain-containing protein [Cereibacter sphaeroides]
MSVRKPDDETQAQAGGLDDAPAGAAAPDERGRSAKGLGQAATQNHALIVGIGASAGGIRALEGFFRHMPHDMDAAFVVVTHLNPERESLLHQVIGRQTSMPVEIAAPGQKVLPGHVYVLPQGHILTIRRGCLELEAEDSLTRERKPIDVFLSSLAVDQGENAVGIIMSGGDSDGTLGVKAVKERGGITMAQISDGSEVQNAEMPDSAIASGLVDFAISVEEMGPTLQRIRQSHGALADIVAREHMEGEAGTLTRAQIEIARILRTHCGHDFARYKGKTFLRRVRRRMQVAHIPSLEAYIERLRTTPGEAQALFRDLLINVTDFFRDAEAFATLESTVIPRLFQGRGADETIRVWVPGCATGEEVYSIGILMREAMEASEPAPRVQIFATDIDEPALSVARAGRYPEPMLESVSPERRKRFFRREGASFVVSKDVRDLCIFSPHSVISDPPFSRMDLVSCRNLLIYFGADLQKQVIPTFHYALRPGGYLFLGTSESIGAHGDLFAPVDKKQRIFQSRGLDGRRPRLPLALGGSTPVPARFEDGERAQAASGYHLRQRVESQVLDHHAPPHVVITRQGDIVFYSARTGQYLEAPRGAPSRQLMELVRRELRLDLRAALRQTLETGRIAERCATLLAAEDEPAERVEMTVEPLEAREGGEPLFLVLFRSLGAAPGAREADATAPHAAEALEIELREMRERLQSTVEEYETALEELKSSNEELVSVNEEAQSTNEELEASKEEMQSLNEELSTINLELNSKVEELDRANSDLANLYRATQIATVFLDRNLVIRHFTPAASAFFNLRASDVGRPLTELASVLDYPELQDHMARVFASGELLEHRLDATGDARHYLVRLNPYRDGGEVVQGVVVTFVDITGLARAEAQQKVLIAELNHRVKNMLSVVISIVHMTGRRSPEAESFIATLVERLHGMARAYDLLSRVSWSQVRLRDLAGLALGGYGERRIDLTGPDVLLSPTQALALGMVIHELATNAAKYGALSGGAGRVSLGWTIEHGRVGIAWQEHDGPPVARPDHKGFGLTLIEGQVQSQLQGTVEEHFEPDGFRLTLTFPLNAERDRDAG